MWPNKAIESAPVGRPTRKSDALLLAAHRWRWTVGAGNIMRLIVAILATLALPGCSDPIASSHIGANAPEDDAFSSILTRDLKAYARQLRGDAAEARYELLRKAPTQSGIAFPKYYAWVELLDDSEQVVESGAARIAAINQTHFEVTHFIYRSEIRSDPAVLRSVFPEALCGTIEARAGVL